MKTLLAVIVLVLIPNMAAAMDPREARARQAENDATVFMQQEYREQGRQIDMENAQRNPSFENQMRLLQPYPSNEPGTLRFPWMEDND